MGQLTLMSPLSYLTTFPCRFIGLATVVGLVLLSADFLVNAQNCQFKDVDVDKTNSDAWVIRGSPISERTKEGDTIWDVRTENIVASRSFQRPHERYLTGLRYSTRYVYKASSFFPVFVGTEGVTKVQRNVSFDCREEDDTIKSTIKINFQFPLIDENDPPEFIAQPKDNLLVDLSTVTKDDILNEGDDQKIIVRDPDFSPDNNKIEMIDSDRRELIITEFVSMEDDSPIGKSYRINLKLNLTREADDIPIGIYSLNLICSDGQFTASTRIGINIIKSQGD